MKEYFLGIFKPDEREIAPFNGARTLGFFMLIYGHMYRTVQVFIPDIDPYLRNFLNNGSVCLDLFFPLSGFLIASPLFAELESKGTINWKFFYLKRSLRIFPPFYIFLILQYFVFIPAMLRSAPPEYVDQIIAAKSKIWFDFLYLSDYFKGTMFHGWSLSLEEQFYIAFPIFLLGIFRFVPKRFRLGFLILLTAAPLIYRAIFMYTVVLKTTGSESVDLYNGYIYYPFHGHIDSVLYGIIFAYIFNFHKSWVEKALQLGPWANYLHAGLWIGLLAYTALVNEFEMGFHQIIRYPSFALLWIGIFILSMRKGDPIGKFLSWKGFSPFAKLSYCAYIIHIVVMTPISRKLLYADKQLQQHEFLLYTIPVGLTVFFFAYFYHLITEKPFAILKDKLIAKYKVKMTSQVFSEQLQKVSQS